MFLFYVINSLIIDIFKINEKISSLNYINTFNIILLKLLMNNYLCIIINTLFLSPNLFLACHVSRFHIIFWVSFCHPLSFLLIILNLIYNNYDSFSFNYIHVYRLIYMYLYLLFYLFNKYD